MRTQPRVAIKVAAAALALSGCSIAVGTTGGTPVAQASVVPARHVPGDSRSADLRNLAQAKRDAGWAAVQRARAAASPDSGLAACTSLSGGQPGAASDYPKIAAQFAGSWWPDLRLSGLAYVEIATQLLATHAYGGETVWFYQRLSAACAKHGRPLDF
jgi:hypothetical protein